MRISEMNWMMVEEYLGRDDRAVLPLGCTEQHAYLSLSTDSILAERLAVEAAEPLGVPVFPVLAYGITPYFRAFPGTITLRVETYMSVVRDILDAMAEQGFKRMLIVNGHGGNIAALSAFLPDFSRETALKVRVTTYFDQAKAAMAEILEDQQSVHHACEAETSLMMAVAFHTVRREKLPEAHGPAQSSTPPAGVGRYRSFRDITASGVIGDARRASAQKGEKLLSALRDGMAALIRNPQTWS